MTIKFDEDKQNLKLNQLHLEEEEKAMQILSDKYGISYIDLTRVPINTDGLRLITEQNARENKMAVFEIVGNKISIAVNEPTNPGTSDIIKELESKNYHCRLFMASIHSLEKAWDRYKDLSFAFETEAGSLDISNEEIESLIGKAEKLEDVVVLIKEALAIKQGHRISRILAVIMAGALSLKASDVHIEPEMEKTRLRYRLDGVLVEAIEFDPDTYKLILSRIKLLSGLKLNIKESSQDGRYTVKIYMTDIEIRTSTIPGAYGESIVMRILNPKSISVGLEQLGMSARLFNIVKKEIARPNGLILTTGPTGSGKTTSLYAFLKYVLSPEYKIITIEDPIEYHLPGIVQTQVEEKKGYTFESGLRSAMRQDPDIIMVGEIRDSETATTAIQAAMTGHLVFSTLHTNNAAGTFTRLVDLGADPKVLTSAIHIALAQRLIRVLCPKCKKQVKIPEIRIPLVKEVLSGIRDQEEAKEFTSVPEFVYDSVGCLECNNTGFQGRLGVFEAVISDAAVERIVRENPSEREIKAASKKQNIMDMKQDGVLKVLRGVTSFEELERVVDLNLEEKDDETLTLS